MSTLGSKHVEENNILWINNNQCIKLVINIYSVLCINFLFCWFFPKGGSRSGECVIDVNLGKEEDEFLIGHAIDGRVLFPATGYLVSWSYVNVMCSHIIRVDRCRIWVWYQVITCLSFILFPFNIIWTTWELWCCGIHWMFVAGCFKTMCWSWQI